MMFHVLYLMIQTANLVHQMVIVNHAFLIVEQTIEIRKVTI